MACAFPTQLSSWALWELAGLQAGGLGNSEQYCPQGQPKQGGFRECRALPPPPTSTLQLLSVPSRMEPQGSTPSGAGHLLVFSSPLSHMCVLVCLSSKWPVPKSLNHSQVRAAKPYLYSPYVLSWGSFRTDEQEQSCLLTHAVHIILWVTQAGGLEPWFITFSTKNKGLQRNDRRKENGFQLPRVATVGR